MLDDTRGRGRPRPRRWLVGAAGVILVGAGLAACGDDDGGDHDGHGDAAEVAEGARRIQVEASSMAFVPEVIEVAAGEEVALVLTSTDIGHDLVVDELGVHLAAERGETVEGGLMAEEPSTYAVYCSEPGHREAGMEAELVVR